MGPLLRQAAECVRSLTGADRTYVCLWSHAGWEPVHIHYVVQPVMNSDRENYAAPGPALQAEMFSRREPLPAIEVEAYCNRARDYFSRGGASRRPPDAKVS